MIRRYLGEWHEASDLVGTLQGLLGGAQEHSAKGRAPETAHHRCSGAHHQPQCQKAERASTKTGVTSGGQKRGNARRPGGRCGEVLRVRAGSSRAALVHAFRKGDVATPGALADRLHQSKQSAEAFLLDEIKAATGAEEAADLRGCTLSFSYLPA